MIAINTPKVNRNSKVPNLKDIGHPLPYIRNMIKEIFKAGTWTDSSGKTRKFTNNDLDEIIAGFDNSKSLTTEGRRVPLTPGHPSDDDPALGWVKRLWREGSKLMAEFVDIVPKAVEAIKAKSFREVSIALTGKILRHVGLLGAVPPAVPGMGGFEFSDGDYTEYKYQEDEDEDKKIEGIFTRLFNKFNNKGGEMPTPLETQLTEANADLKTKLADMTSKFEEAEEAKTTAETTATDATTAKDKAEGELKDNKEAGEKAEGETADKADMAWVDKQIEGKKMLPAGKESTVAIMKSLRGQPEQDFSVGDKKEKKTPLDVYKSGIEANSEVLDTETLGEGMDRKDTDKLMNACNKYMADHEGVNYEQATEAVLKSNPELEQYA